MSATKDKTFILHVVKNACVLAHKSSPFALRLCAQASMCANFQIQNTRCKLLKIYLKNEDRSRTPSAKPLNRANERLQRPWGKTKTRALPPAREASRKIRGRGNELRKFYTGLTL